MFSANSSSATTTDLFELIATCLTVFKVDDMAMIKNPYNRIPHPAKNIKRVKEHKQLRRHQAKQHTRKARSSVPTQQMATKVS